MLGAVGDDAFGRDLLQGLEQAGVETGGVKVRVGEQTGVAVIVVEEETGENRILVSALANATVTAEEFGRVPVPVPDLIVLQLEIAPETVVAVTDAARASGVEVLLNPAPAVELPDHVYVGVTHLILNETEAAMLCGHGGEWELQPAGRVFLNRGVRNVVITLGARGAFYCSAADERGGIAEGKLMDVVDTTAAGDTFVGAYAVRVARHMEDGTPFDLEAAVKWANVAASKTVEKEGAQDSIPWLDELHSV